ncbi:peroxisomal membrane protein 4-like [Anneissia japonica]|uniref:peroxisomal membrane protein 4-like n=1 Tax=Anneissia japonica TaxID=1529436 RepID=UPI00142583FE|nr:peroxisomal membrane protein 4-like [Anneissia japonica]
MTHIIVSKMAAPIAALNDILASGQYTQVLSVIKGFRNGVVYGAKIRFPHALVMTFLFKRGPLKDKLISILRATYTHSRNLSYFVFIYKVLTGLFRKLESKPRESHSFIAACIGGYLVFGENNNINSQINMYLLSRITFGLCRLMVKKGAINPPRRDPFPMFGMLVWGIVLWLFEYHQEVLQPSLQNSMTYLYHDSNTWHNIWDFIIYNKPTK